MRYYKDDFRPATKYLYSHKSDKPIGKTHITHKYRIVKYIPDGAYMIEETSSLKTEPQFYREAHFGDGGMFGYIASDTMKFLRVENAIKVLDRYAIKHNYTDIGRGGAGLASLEKSTPQTKTPPKAPAKAQAKKSTKNTPVKTAKRLLAEGSLKEGHVRRLGIRRQTPPRAKSQAADRKRNAMLPGYRVSASGNMYYESRANRSDTPVERKDYTYGATHRKGTRLVKKTLGKAPDKYTPRIFSTFRPNDTQRGEKAWVIYYLDPKKIKNKRVLTEEQQWAAAKKIMRKHKNSKVEFTFAVDKYGNMLYHSTGSDSSCSGPSPTWYYERKDLRLIDIHCHPIKFWNGNTCTFSRGDLKYFHSHYVYDAAVFGEDGRVYRIRWNNRNVQHPFPIDRMQNVHNSAHIVSEREAPNDPKVMDAASNMIDAAKHGESQEVIDKLKKTHSHLLSKTKIDITVREYIKMGKESGRFTFTEDKI